MDIELGCLLVPLNLACTEHLFFNDFMKFENISDQIKRASCKRYITRKGVSTLINESHRISSVFLNDPFDHVVRSIMREVGDPMWSPLDMLHFEDGVPLEPYKFTIEESLTREASYARTYFMVIIENRVKSKLIVNSVRNKLNHDRWSLMNAFSAVRTLIDNGRQSERMGEPFEGNNRHQTQPSQNIRS